ncbi:hypothetical protein INR49_017113 [Caranx melampygus]|nr:hypothetical protein INR49_017113 [Caranx melampygus]
MSSYYPRTKDLTRTRKSVTDSPPSSPSPADKNYRWLILMGVVRLLCLCQCIRVELDTHDRLSRYDSSGESATDKPLGRTSSYTRRETRLAALNRQEQDSTTKDYKKMYAEALHENERLKSRLQDSKQELVKIRAQLEKVTQEKQALEKRVSDMEEEIKAFPALAQVQTLRRVNECLLAENRAMLRALARLSETASMPETEDL